MTSNEIITDLLEACKEALTQAEGCFLNHYPGDDPAQAAEPLHIAMMRAAIAKATQVRAEGQAMTSDERVERVAKAIYDRMPRHPKAQWSSEPQIVREGYRCSARAALAAAGPDMPGENVCASPRGEASDEHYRALLRFAWMALEGFWYRYEGEMQEAGIKCGLLVETKYDPEKHRLDSYGADPGDEWYVFADWLQAETSDLWKGDVDTRGEANPLSSCGEKP
jgi:hypothetical protein